MDGQYSVKELPLGMPRLVRIVGIGAGASGLNMIRTLRQHLVQPYEHVVYEKNAAVGGTWYENRYPGCRCDVPSHNYQFSWKTKLDWSNFCAPAAEIEEYLCQICEEENMGPVIKTSHRVRSARWDEPRGVWELTVQDSEGQVFDDHAHFLVDAGGILKYVFIRYGHFALAC